MEIGGKGRSNLDLGGRNVLMEVKYILLNLEEDCSRQVQMP